MFPIGLGCASFSSAYGPADERESIETIHAAIDAGVTLLDTSDAYGNGHNETLLGKALRGRHDEITLLSKYGNRRSPAGERLGADGRPQVVIESCERSLERLGVDCIDIYCQHRVDPKVPIEETIGAAARLVEQGKVRYLGLCEAGSETIRQARATHPIHVLETEYSLWTRDIEAGILPACREAGIAIVAYAPLGRGFLTSTIRSSADLHAGERRHAHPRFRPENIARNVPLLDALNSIAAEVGVSPAQVALAWLLSRGSDIVPIPASRHIPRMRENVAAATVELAVEVQAALAEVFRPGIAAGMRYPEKQMAGMGL